MKIVLVILLLFNSCYSNNIRLKEGESKVSFYQFYPYGTNKIYSKEICPEDQVILSLRQIVTYIEMYLIHLPTISFYRPLLIKIECGVEARP
jgi:hypothetical protein